MGSICGAKRSNVSANSPTKIKRPNDKELFNYTTSENDFTGEGVKRTNVWEAKINEE